MKLSQLQNASDRKGRVNTVYVRADDTDAVAGVSKSIEATLDGASVTTTQDLADRVGGSLVDAKNLASKLGTALAIVALIASVLIAILLTLSSVAKRTRELGTLKAIGWRQGRVVRQVSGESLMQGALGGVFGAVLGIAAAAIIGALGVTLQASVANAAGGGAGGPGGGPGGPPGGGLIGGFGQGQIVSGSTDVVARCAGVLRSRRAGDLAGDPRRADGRRCGRDARRPPSSCRRPAHARLTPTNSRQGAFDQR